MGLHEPAVALTDFLLALECGAFAFLLLRNGGGGRGGVSARAAFGVFFAAAAAAAFLGGLVHGFFPDPAGIGNRALWTLTLLAVGLTAAAAAVAALRLGRWPAADGRAVPALGLLLLAYAAVVLWISRRFVIAIAAYLPATLLLLAVLAGRWRRHRETASLLGIIGLLLTLLAAGLQQAGVGIHPKYFDHNALYHVVQALAMYLLFRCALAGRGERVMGLARGPCG